MNALNPINVHELGMLIDLINEHPKNASEPIFVIFDGSLIAVILSHDLNNFDGISLMLSESVTSVISEHFENAPLPIVVTDCGILIFVIAVSVKASSPIDVSLLGNSNLESLVHFANAPEPIVLSVSGKSNDVRLWQFYCLFYRVSIKIKSC